MNPHFLVVGLLFFWPLVGVDPAPRRWPPSARLGFLFASVPFHAFFGVALMSSNTVIGGDFYRALALPWVTDRSPTRGSAAAWRGPPARSRCSSSSSRCSPSGRGRTSGRRGAVDRRADADGDADLVAYNAMLRRLATKMHHSSRTATKPGVNRSGRAGRTSPRNRDQRSGFSQVKRLTAGPDRASGRSTARRRQCAPIRR